MFSVTSQMMFVLDGVLQAMPNKTKQGKRLLVQIQCLEHLRDILTNVTIEYIAIVFLTGGVLPVVLIILKHILLFQINQFLLYEHKMDI